MNSPIKIIDLFAGPGGLGEGFSALRRKKGERVFKISLSVEKEASAHKTLKLRAFYRQFREGEAPQVYYDFLSGKLGASPDILYRDPSVRRQAEAASDEARQFTLGEDNRAINNAIEKALGKRPDPWVLIGGPPCQAYSLAGRSRNAGNKNYRAEDDHRNFLYKEYLRVIARFKPAVFVMENVKGLLSAKINGAPIFDDICRDLECPARALKTGNKRQKYTIFSLTTSLPLNSDLFNTGLEPADYIIHAEQYGVPQARHRVILLGIRNDIASKAIPGTLHESSGPSVKEIIGGLPALRSGLSKSTDNSRLWAAAIHNGINKVIAEVNRNDKKAVAQKMITALKIIDRAALSRGSNWAQGSSKNDLDSLPANLKNWYQDPSGWSGICNHETRGHIATDLHRYLFCACYSQATTNGERATPTSSDFPETLAPDHANWKSGKFADRFRVQSANRYATTITSHISKDGHYYIHYDPNQCRSLTVREAARIQTFPDNYFFVGNRTEQYVQVGNAVPPYLAHQIAEIVYKLLSSI